MSAFLAVVLGAAASPYCGISPARTGNPDVTPCLGVPRCPETAVIESFKVSTAPGLVAPLQSTTVAVCYDKAGITVQTNATDTDVFNTCTTCQCSVRVPSSTGAAAAAADAAAAELRARRRARGVHRRRALGAGQRARPRLLRLILLLLLTPDPAAAGLLPRARHWRLGHHLDRADRARARQR